MDLDKILTIGVTSHNSNVNSQLLEKLKSFQHIQVLISEDANKTEYKNIKTIFCDETGTEPNRINIIHNTNTKYLFLVDADDTFILNENEVLEELSNRNEDILYIKTFTNEDPRENVGERYGQVYIACWEQLFRTEFIIDKVFKTWNGFSEETPIHMYINSKFPEFTRTSINSITYKYNGGHFDKVDFNGMKHFLLELKKSSDIDFQKIVYNAIMLNITRDLMNIIKDNLELKHSILKDFYLMMSEVTLEENW